ncbi:hypothetical protein V1291_000064 [Nitrobacteraceae bacterium AZCC 1564]
MFWIGVCVGVVLTLVVEALVVNWVISQLD